MDPDRNLIKGRGGAMFMEKVVMHASPRNFILVDQSKLVTRLGLKFPIPVEVLPIAMRVVERELAAIGAVEIVLRLAVKKDGPVITEHGNFILDVRFGEIRKIARAGYQSGAGRNRIGPVYGARRRDRGCW